MKLIKWIPFALLILIIIFLVDFFSGGIKNRLIRYWIEKDNPSASREVIENPLPDIGYSLLKDDFFLTGKSYPCASNEVEAEEILTSHIKRVINSKSYFEREIQPLIRQLTTISDNQFYTLTLPTKVYGYDVEHLFNCNYFVPLFADVFPVYSETNNSKLGILNSTRTKKGLDDLIWLLNNLEIIQYGGFNQNTELYSSTLEESESTITRKDEGIYSVFNDVPPFQTKKYRVTYLYTLDKSTGEVSMSHSIEK